MTVMVNGKIVGRKDILDNEQYFFLSQDEADDAIANNTPLGTLVSEINRWARLTKLAHEDSTPVLWEDITEVTAANENTSDWSIDLENQFISI